MKAKSQIITHQAEAASLAFRTKHCGDLIFAVLSNGVNNTVE